jgi:hypothetical protein
LKISDASEKPGKVQANVVTVSLDNLVLFLGIHIEQRNVLRRKGKAEQGGRKVKEQERSFFSVTKLFFAAFKQQKRG